MHLPSLSEIEKLHHKYASSAAAFELVYAHCQAVTEIAMQLMDTNPISANRDLVRVGGLLHDIGTYEFLEGSPTRGNLYIRHGIIGEEILRRENYPDAICRFASHHTGTGISRQEIVERHLPLPPADYFADTIEERLLMYADKFHSKEPIFNSYTWYRHYVGKFGHDKQKAFDQFAAEFGKPDLLPIMHKFNQGLRDS